MLKPLSTPSSTYRYQVVRADGLPDVELTLFADDQMKALSPSSVPVYLREILSFRQRVGLDQIETALLLGCARKYVAMLNGKISGPITSLSYFQSVVDEVGNLQMSVDYTKYLRQRVARLEEQWLGQNAPRIDHHA